MLPQIEDRRAIHHRRFEAETEPKPPRPIPQFGEGMGDRPLVGRHHVHPSIECRPDMRDRRLAIARIERGQFHRDLGPGGVQELANRFHARSEDRFQGKPGGIHGRSMPQRMNACDRKWKLAPLLRNQLRQCPGHVAVSNESELQRMIVAEEAEAGREKRNSLSHYFNNDALGALSVELGVVNLLPWTKIELAFGHRHNHFVMHQQALQV